MQKTLGMMLMLLAVSAACFASPTTPEIDPATGSSALALVAGALLVVRGRKK